MAVIAAALVIGLFGGPSASAVDKESLAPDRGMNAMANLSVGNEYVQAQVGPDGLFNFGLDRGGTGNYYNISYAWPSYPWSSFSTVKIDGANTVLGAGGQTQSPANLDALTNQTTWRFGDVSVRQVISAGLNPSTGRPDAAQIRYTFTNLGTAAHDVGLRIMIDTMLRNNDGAPFRVPGPAGMEAVIHERDYVGAQVPDFWQAFRDLADPDIASQWTARGGGATAPDRMAIAYWGRITDYDWDYTINPDDLVTWDSAVGMWWNPRQLAPGHTLTVTQFYGAPQVVASTDLVLSCPSQLSPLEWTQDDFSFNLVAYLNNGTNDPFTGTTMTVSPGSMELVADEAEHAIGLVDAHGTAQTNWHLRPTEPGLQTLTVTAQSDAGPIATQDCTVDVLPPAVPDNVTITGPWGEDDDGTPIASTISWLTVTGHFPGANAVLLEATKAGEESPTYTADMTFAGGGDWVHTFLPHDVGLLDDFTMTLTPDYGEPAEFNIILIDPSGLVYNANKGIDWVLPGATVTLEYFDPELASWVIMDNAAYPERMEPVNNPETTSADGAYGWDVADGRYRVRVSRAGFATATSAPVDVPPEVTDLNVGLTPTDAEPPVITYTGAVGGTNYPGPVTINLSATDNSSGVRSLAYQADGGAWTDAVIVGDSLTVGGDGPHTIVMKATDYAGNEATEQLTFNIGAVCTQQPVLTWLPPMDAAAPEVPAGQVMPVSFTWTKCGEAVEDRSVAIRIRNAATNTLIAGYTLGAGIIYDPATGAYTQNVDTAKYKLTAGTRVKVMVYFGSKLTATKEFIVR
jgi:hypothetical protein